MACGDHVDVLRTLRGSDIWSGKTYFIAILVVLDDMSGFACCRHVDDLRSSAAALSCGNLVRGPARLHGVTASCRAVLQVGTHIHTTALTTPRFGLNRCNRDSSPSDSLFGQSTL
jgi:hypothetical protein